MSIKKDLKKEGIEVRDKLDTLKINSIAKRISEKITDTFPELNIEKAELFRNISRLNMYYAKLPEGISAKYFYKNKTIYFSESLKQKELADIAIHECIHHLQERFNERGELIRLGLCDYTSSKLPGTGLNEAAVQLMTARCTRSDYENVKYFGIDIPTNTESYYPLECALVNQMAYVIGEDVLFDSTINSNDRFKMQYISLTSEKTFNTLQKNIDLLVEKQDQLKALYSFVQFSDANDRFVIKCIDNIEKMKTDIKELFLNTQKLILTSYFDNAINLAYVPKQIENYRNKLYLFKNLIGQVEGDNFFNEYYISKMVELEKRYDIKNTEIRDLVVVKHNFIATLFRKIKLLFGFEKEYVNNN